MNEKCTCGRSGRDEGRGVTSSAPMLTAPQRLGGEGSQGTELTQKASWHPWEPQSKKVRHVTHGLNIMLGNRGGRRNVLG